MPTIIYQDDVIEEIELGGPGSGFKDHKGRDATNQRGGSLPRGQGSEEPILEVWEHPVNDWQDKPVTVDRFVLGPGDPTDPKTEFKNGFMDYSEIKKELGIIETFNYESPTMWRSMSEGELKNVMQSGEIQSTNAMSFHDQQGMTFYGDSPSAMYAEDNFKAGVVKHIKEVYPDYPDPALGQSAYIIEVVKPKNIQQNHVKEFYTTEPLPASEIRRIIQVRPGYQNSEGFFGAFGYREVTKKYVQTHLSEFVGFDESKHPRDPKGSATGGHFKGKGAATAVQDEEVLSFLQDKIDSAERMNKKHPGMIEQRWLDKLHAAQEVYKAYVEKYGEDYPIVLIKDQPEVERRPWYGVIIAPSSKESGEWQATTFDQQGFSGDFSEKSKGAVYWEVFNQGMRRPDPELLESVSKTDLFQAGNKWSMLPDKEKWETSIQEVLKGMTAGASLGEYYDHLLELLQFDEAKHPRDPKGSKTGGHFKGKGATAQDDHPPSPDMEDWPGYEHVIGPVYRIEDNAQWIADSKNNLVMVAISGNHKGEILVSEGTEIGHGGMLESNSFKDTNVDEWVHFYNNLSGDGGDLKGLMVFNEFAGVRINGNDKETTIEALDNIHKAMRTMISKGLPVEYPVEVHHAYEKTDYSKAGDLSEFGGFDESKHPRDPKGSKTGGHFKSKGQARDINGALLDTDEDRKRRDDYIAKQKEDYARRNEVRFKDNYSQMTDDENRAYWITPDDKIMCTSGYQAMGTPAHTLIMAKYIMDNPNDFSDTALEKATETFRIGEQENYSIEREGFDKGFIKVRDPQTGTLSIDLPDSLVGAPNVWDDKSIREKKATQVVKKLYNKNLITNDFENITIYNGGRSIINVERLEVVDFSLPGPTVFYLDGTKEVQSIV